MASSGDGGGWVSVDSYHDYRPDLVAQLYNELLAPSFLDPAGTTCGHGLSMDGRRSVDARLCGSARRNAPSRQSTLAMRAGLCGR